MSIADTLLTPRQQKILAPLLLNPQQQYRLSELLALSGTGRGASQKHIDNFLRAGLLKEERRGNQRCIQINTAFPLYADLRSICLKSFGLSEELRKVLTPVVNSITQAFVFGSFANNTDRAESDIDLMVVGSVDLMDLMNAIAPFEKQIGRSIHVNLHDDKTWQEVSSSDPIILQILQSPVIKIVQNEEAA